MVLITTVNVVTGAIFLLLGAWPVFLFCGLDVALIYWAFRLNYRSGQMSETIEIRPSRVSLVRIHPSGAVETYALNPYWARVTLQERLGRCSKLMFTSHGQHVVFGSFLSDDERLDLARVLRDELRSRQLSTGARIGSPPPTGLV